MEFMKLKIVEVGKDFYGGGMKIPEIFVFIINNSYCGIPVYARRQTIEVQ